MHLSLHAGLLSNSGAWNTAMRSVLMLPPRSAAAPPAASILWYTAPSRVRVRELLVPPLRPPSSRALSHTQSESKQSKKQTYNDIDGKANILICLFCVSTKKDFCRHSFIHDKEISVEWIKKPFFFDNALFVYVCVCVCVCLCAHQCTHISTCMHV